MKTDNRILLKNGYLIFLSDRLVISDRSRIEQMLILIVFFFTSAYGMYNILSFTAVDHPIYYYSGVLVLLMWVFATPLLISRTYRHVLFYKEIGNINVMKISNGDFNARFKLKKGKTRFVYLNNSHEDFSMFLNKLKELQLELEIQH